MQDQNETKKETDGFNAGDPHKYPITIPPPYPGPPQAAPTSYPQIVHGPLKIHDAPALTPIVVPTAVVGDKMSHSPMVCVCKSCNHQVVTRVKRYPSMRTHINAVLLCAFGCAPFVCVPYFLDCCNNADHYCTYCGAYIGSYLG